MSCPTLRTQYNLLLQKEKDLEQAIQAGTQSGNFANAQKLKIEVLNLKESLEQYCFTNFTVAVEKGEDAGKEIEFNMKEILKEKKAWYEARGLKAFADALPKTIRISSEDKQRIIETIKRGEANAVEIMPGIQIQEENMQHLADLATSKTKDTDTDEYKKKIKALYPNDPYIEDDTILASTPRNRPDTPYLVFYSTHDVPQETKGKSPEELEKIYKYILSLPEYLLAQRIEAEKRNDPDHPFDRWDDDKNKSQAIWLDSRTQTQEEHALYAYWRPVARRVRVYWLDVRGRGSGIGARPAAIAPIL